VSINTKPMNDHYACGENLSNHEFDVVFVGAGLSTAMTLIHYLTKKLDIKNSNKSSEVTLEKILVLEKSADFFKGIAYGGRSGYNSLIINSLGDFLPPEEYDAFSLWLKENSDALFIPFLRDGGEFSRNWYDKYHDLILKGDIESLYLPRYIFGEYLKQKTDLIIENAVQQGVAEISCVSAKVLDLTTEPSHSNFRVKIEQLSDIQSFSCKSIILGIGSPPENVFFKNKSSTPGGYIENPFNPSMSKTISHASEISKNRDSSDVLIIGSNASALDVIVNLTSSDELRDRLNRIFVMSPGGELPELYLESEEHRQYKTVLLDKLIDKTGTTAADILEQAKAEITNARSQGYTIAMSLGSVSATVGKILPSLDSEQRSIFVSSVGNLIGKLQRRAGADYFEMVESLIVAGKLKTISGKFKTAEENGDGYDIHYSTSEHMDCELNNIQIIINCTGSTKLPTKTSNTLIDKLVSSGICEINGSQIGIKVDSSFQTKTKGIYVMGPMLAGNILNNQLVWHIEHCRRISVAADKLASTLIA
jgi:uncharacterized NAD(P)/FAD-binding protein YdhS